MSYRRRLDWMTAKEQVQAAKRRTFMALELVEGNAALDVGCGTGDDARALAEAVAEAGASSAWTKAWRWSS